MVGACFFFGSGTKGRDDFGKCPQPARFWGPHPQREAKHPVGWCRPCGGGAPVSWAAQSPLPASCAACWAAHRVPQVVVYRDSPAQTVRAPRHLSCAAPTPNVLCLMERALPQCFGAGLWKKVVPFWIQRSRMRKQLSVCRHKPPLWRHAECVHVAVH